MPKPNNPEKCQATFWLSRETAELLATAASETGRTKTAIVDAALRNFLKPDDASEPTEMIDRATHLLELASTKIKEEGPVEPMHKMTAAERAAQAAIESEIQKRGRLDS